MQIINKVQKAILNLFGQVSESDSFYFTGGTALAEFYLNHRRSNDLDFFTATEEIIVPFSQRLEEILKANDGNEVDIAINCLSITNSELSSILPVRDGGIVYFFSMATSFTKAALGAEGIGKDVTMIIGNGYTKDHVQITLDLLRESKTLRKIFEEKYIK